VRDAEREMTFNEFKDRKGELITGIVRRFEKGNIIVDLNRAEAILPRREQVVDRDLPPRRPHPGLRARHHPGGEVQPQVVLSRSHPGLLMKLFEIEVPEIYEGIVRIEACAREPGTAPRSPCLRRIPTSIRSAPAWASRAPVFRRWCSELRGEAIDIIPYHPDPARFIVHAIAPASVSRVYIDEHTHCMELIVPDEQLSKAIGRRGQNVRLAAQLTGWRVDIYSETRHSELNELARAEFARLDGVDADTIELLIRHGFRTVKDLTDAEPYELASILDVEEEEAASLINHADKVLDALIYEDSQRKKQANEIADDLPPEADA
jgi:N utilization substance protein A